MSDKEQTVDRIYVYNSTGLITGFNGEHIVNEGVEISYNDGTVQLLVVENLTTQVYDNPLTGFKEVTVKLYLKGEDV